MKSNIHTKFDSQDKMCFFSQKAYKKRIKINIKCFLTDIYVDRRFFYFQEECNDIFANSKKFFIFYLC
jgi:hypothetical protein